MMKLLAHLFFWIALVIGVLGALGAHYRYLLSIVGFGMVAAALLIGGVGFFISIIALFRSESGRRLLVLFTLVELACLGGLGYGIWFGSQHPINDITTDTKDAPAFVAPHFMATILSGQEYLNDVPKMERPYDSSFAGIQSRVYGPMIPSTARVAPADALKVVDNTVKEAFPNWRIVKVDPEKLVLQAEEESKFFRFVDDIVVRVSPVNSDPHASRIDVRSRSRFGKGDFGVNAERVKSFFNEFRPRAQKFAASLVNAAQPNEVKK